MPEFIPISDMATYEITVNGETTTWSGWVNSYVTTTSSATVTWTNWVDTSNSSALYGYRATPEGTQLLVSSRSAEEIEASRAEHAAAVERQRERDRELERKKREAGERALETLRLILTDTQWEQWQREQQFELVTQSGRRYSIRRGVAGNIRLIEDGEPVEALCAHPHTAVRGEDQRVVGFLPTEDVVVAQVLALRADEEGFRRTANITRLRRVNRGLASCSGLAS